MDSTAAADAFVGEFALVMLVALAIYIVPTVIAFSRRHPNRYLILVINVVFGGTGLGWLVCLIWAIGVVHLPGTPSGSRGGESGLNLFVNDSKDVRLLAAPAAADTPSVASVAPMTAAAAVAELDKLARLKAAGALSEGEFAALKSAVLRRLRDA